jgi:hypothetical protein
MSGFTCNFCNKQFSSKSCLNVHIKTAKFCLDSRESSNELLEHENLNCEFCKKVFTVKSSFQRHITICKEKYVHTIENQNTSLEKLKKEKIDEIEKLKKEKIDEIQFLNKKHQEEINILNKKYEEEITKLKNKISEQEKRIIQIDTTNLILKENIRELNRKNDSLLNNSKLVINQTNNNYIGVEFSQQCFDKVVEDKYTYQYYVEGKEGAKKLIINFLYRDDDIKEVIVTDSSRDKIKIMDCYGNFKTINFDQLYILCKESKTLSNLLKEYSKKFFESHTNDPFEEITEQVIMRNLLFKKKNLKDVYKNVKAQISIINQIEHIEEKKEPEEEKQHIYTNSSIPSTFGVQVTPMGLETRDSLYSPEVIEKHRKYLEEHPFDEEKYNLSLQDLQNDSDSD